MVSDTISALLKNEQEIVLVGVVNITPDSFSDGGKYLHSDHAIEHAQQLLTDGAHIIELGAESTRPGATPITAEEEQRRLLPVVQRLAALCPLAIDTIRSETAQKCLSLGAQVINDVSALRHDPLMVKVIAEFNAWVVLMHSKQPGDHPHVTEDPKDYSDLVLEVSEFLKARIQFSISEGISHNKIILDSGMGKFLSHDARYSFELLKNFNQLVEQMSPFPLMIGTSRKGFLGSTLEERDPVSQLSALLACAKGARLIRTHNIRMAKAFLELWNSI